MTRHSAALSDMGYEGEDSCRVPHAGRSGEEFDLPAAPSLKLYLASWIGKARVRLIDCTLSM